MLKFDWAVSGTGIGCNVLTMIVSCQCFMLGGKSVAGERCEQ